MPKYNVNANLVCVIEHLYDKTISAAKMNGSTGEWLRTSWSKARMSSLLPTLYNIFIERNMSDALEEHDGKVSIDGKTITILQFADDVDALAEKRAGARSSS